MLPTASLMALRASARPIGRGIQGGIENTNYFVTCERDGTTEEHVLTVFERLSFEQIAGGAVAGRGYDTIVCSFALHLAPLSRLPALAIQLSLLAGTLLVLTPHKRPEIRAAWGWVLEGELLHERVRARCYRSGAELSS